MRGEGEGKGKKVSRGKGVIEERGSWVEEDWEGREVQIMR